MKADIDSPVKANITIKFNNRSNEKLDYYSVDQNGKYHKKWSLEPNKSMETNCKTLEPWVISKMNDGRVAVYKPPLTLDNTKKIEVVTDSKFRSVKFYS